MHLIEEINVRDMIVHVLDNGLTTPVLSENQIESGISIKSYFAAHILKVINNDDTKHCIFNEEQNKFIDNILRYKQGANGFVQFSKEIAVNLFEIMSVHTMIPAADVAVISFNLMTKQHIAILKMDYQSTYMHYTGLGEGCETDTTIMEHKTTLPGPRQRVAEAIIIRMEDLDIKIIEKKHEIDGVKDVYLSKMFMRCDTDISSKAKMKIVRKATEYMARRFYEHDPDKQAEIKQNLYEALDDKGEIDLREFAEATFVNQEEVKETFMQKIETKGLENAKAKLEEQTIEREFAKQVIKTDKGIEIKVPMHLYNDKSAIEFKTDETGNINIVIKQITKVTA